VAFRENEIKPQVLPNLTTEDTGLSEKGVRPIGLTGFLAETGGRNSP
jgi:hypothetical protein